MDKRIIKGLIDEKLEIIQEQFAIIKEYEGKIPVIEIDLLMSNIRDIYELFVTLQQENQGIRNITASGRPPAILGFEPVLETKPEMGPLPPVTTPEKEPVAPVVHAEPEAVSIPEPEPALATEPEPVTPSEPEPVTPPVPGPVFPADPEPVSKPEPERVVPHHQALLSLCEGLLSTLPSDGQVPLRACASLRSLFFASGRNPGIRAQVMRDEQKRTPRLGERRGVQVDGGWS